MELPDTASAGIPQCLIQPNEVYYYAQLGVGKSVIVISFTRSTPHFVSYYETKDGRFPLSQSIADIQSYLEDASKKLGRS